MSDEKFQALVNNYPTYQGVINAIVDWFKNHPNNRGLRMDNFYNNHFNYSIEEVNAAFMLMSQEEMLKTVYRVLDYDGSKIGKDFESIDDVPEFVDTMWGDKVETKDVFVVPYYLLQL